MLKTSLTTVGIQSHRWWFKFGLSILGCWVKVQYGAATYGADKRRGRRKIPFKIQESSWCSLLKSARIFVFESRWVDQRNRNNHIGSEAETSEHAKHNNKDIEILHQERVELYKNIRKGWDNINKNRLQFMQRRAVLEFNKWAAFMEKCEFQKSSIGRVNAAIFTCSTQLELKEIQSG